MGNKWISANHRLPESGERVLCMCRAGIYEVLKWSYPNWAWYKDRSHCYMKDFVTHWMPLPEPPEEDEK